MMKMEKIFISLILFFILFSFSALSQSHKISGKVIDEKTHEPLAFVNVVYGSKNLGTSTNIDGYFSFQTTSENATLVFSSSNKGPSPMWLQMT